MAPCGPRSRENRDPVIAGCQLCTLDAGRDHPQDGNIHLALDVRKYGAGGRVACYDDHPGSVRLEELDQRCSPSDHLLPWLRSIGKEARVGDIHDSLSWQSVLQFPDHCQPSDSRVKYPYVGFHHTSLLAEVFDNGVCDAFGDSLLKRFLAQKTLLFAVADERTLNKGCRHRIDVGYQV